MEENDIKGGIVKHLLYVNRRAPHGTAYAQESLEIVLIGAAFDQNISLLFLDDGVFQLKSNQKPELIDMKNFSKTFRALEMYDVENIYVERESLQERGLTETDLLMHVTVLERSTVSALIDQQDIVFSF